MTYCIKKVSAVFILENDSKFLFLKRNDKFKGYYLLPGGHIEDNETVLNGAIRELKEELGITVQPQQLQFALLKPTADYMTVFFRVLKYEGDLQNMEPEKHPDMAWLDLSSPEIFPQVVQELKAIQNNIFYLEL